MECSQRDSSLGHALRGVSAEHLRGNLVEWISSHGQDTTACIHEIEPLIRERGKDVMCPHTHQLGSSYVDALGESEDAGISNFMLSYSWRYRVDDIITSLVHHCETRERDMKRTYFWICCLCINQHRVKEAQAAGLVVPFEDFREHFQQRVVGVGHVLALMAPWDNPVYVSRVWCVFEIFTAVNENCELTVILPPVEMKRFSGTIHDGVLDKHLWASLEQLDVQRADASVASDKENILRIVADGVGFDCLNQVVRQQLLRWLATSATWEAQQQMETGDLFGQKAIATSSQIASFLHRLAQYEKARELLACAGRVAAEESEEKANLLRVLGQNLEYLGRRKEAADAYRQASEMLEELGCLRSHDGAAVLTSLALQLSDAGELDEAMERYQKAWSIREATGAQTLDASDLLAMMGVTECKLGLIQEGLRHAQEARRLREHLQQLTTPQGAQVLQQLSFCYLASGDSARALEELEVSRTILEKLGMLRTAQGALLAKRRAQCYCKLKDSTRELQSLREGKVFMEECGQLRSEEGVGILLDLGSALLDARQDEDANHVLALAEEICLEKNLEERGLDCGALRYPIGLLPDVSLVTLLHTAHRACGESKRWTGGSNQWRVGISEGGYIPPVQPQYSAPQAPQYAPQYVPQSTAPMSQLRLTRRGGLDPPAKVDTYNGGAWEVLKLPGKRSMHFFALGDWGGLLGTGYAPMIQYRSGQTPGPHTMARWRGPCKTDKMIACFAGDTCEQSCHYDPQVDRQAQVLVATQMKKRAAQSQPDFIVNVGDNFYWGGINTECGTPMNQISAVTQQQFTEIFEKIYGGPGLDGKPWLGTNRTLAASFFSLGYVSRTRERIAYTWASDRWRLPALYWMQRVEYPDLDFSAEIFMIDSNAMDVKPMHADPEHNICGQLHNPTNARCDATGGPANLKDCFSWMWSLWREQKKWVQQKLTESNANWQIVATHFNCGHEAQWYKELHQKYGLDLLITGHTHDQQVYHESGMLGGLTCFITGGGGGITSEADPSHPKSNQYGFFDISITKQQILLESINYRGETLGKYAVRPKARAL
ncbi:Tartrate-resistant acid phosphatase type 5 (TR-AP) (Tartrate-resistant acid ATPase) (TrATPase) (Type 5 acid phosphatase) (Uteroferrin) (UF) [Durusdinium trenchii]|uniref:Tartrate-resistant acid phosphatase type 5 (TR-AP) (Tartrate-resistant acid ATPase) (TrATPase) (Type 5 acid phosphatase) (Uteroferrin) (UF) n=1 Tax=Durusdinium trenchii TaxID=1381693 RepID=A0ABP0NY16_9DINO